MPFNNDVYFGKVTRWSLASFEYVQGLDLAPTDPALTGFRGGFSDRGSGVVPIGPKSSC